MWLAMVLIVICGNNFTFACTNALDCELLGKCINGACKCFRGFTGASCGSLDLAPIDPKTRGQIWPMQPAPTNQHLSMAWSFTPIFDPLVQRYGTIICFYDYLSCIHGFSHMYGALNPNKHEILCSPAS